jgi:hypothetical protein
MVKCMVHVSWKKLQLRQPTMLPQQQYEQTLLHVISASTYEHQVHHQCSDIAYAGATHLSRKVQLWYFTRQSPAA